MSYEKWYEENQRELDDEFDIIKLLPGTEGYDFADFVIDKWDEAGQANIDDMQESGHFNPL